MTIEEERKRSTRKRKSKHLKMIKRKVKTKINMINIEVKKQNTKEVERINEKNHPNLKKKKKKRGKDKRMIKEIFFL